MIIGKIGKHKNNPFNEKFWKLLIWKNENDSKKKIINKNKKFKNISKRKQIIITLLADKIEYLFLLFQPTKNKSRVK